MRDSTSFDDENEIVSKPVTSLWKRCSSALCAAAHSVKDTTKALLGDWKRNAAFACTCVAVMGVLGVGTTKAETYRLIETRHMLFGINNKNQGVGSYNNQLSIHDVSNDSMISSWDNILTSKTIPGCTWSWGVAINDVGQVVVGCGNVVNGYNAYNYMLYDIISDELTNISTPLCDGNPPSNATMSIGSINNNGEVVGSCAGHGFIYKNGSFTFMDFPYPTPVEPCTTVCSPGRSTNFFDINNNGQITGSWTDNVYCDDKYNVCTNYYGYNPYGYVTHGLIYSNGVWETFDYPGTRYTSFDKINDKGKIIGSYVDDSVPGGTWKSFIYTNDTKSFIDYPNFGSPRYLFDINNAGTLVGEVWSDSGCVDFVAKLNNSTDPKNNGKPSCPNCQEGNPINAATGNKLQIETDYVGSEITGLKIVRAYNSQDTASSPFGSNWRSTWHRGIAQPDANTVKVTREDGRVDTFTNNAGVWTSEPDVTSRLSAVTNGWQLTRDDDSKELYTTDGRLSSITTRAGRVTTLTYDGSKRLTKVTGPFAHTLTFAYDGSNRISTITLPDGKTLGYGYDANNNLSTVTLPNTATRQYHYENAAYPHALTGINDESGQRFATFDYADDGRAISSEHAGGVDKVVLSYEDAKTTVIDPRGNTHGYDLTTQFNLVKPTAMTQNCCGGASYAYDASGFLASRTDFNGSVTTYTHNARGLETSRTEAKGTPQERTISTDWHATYHLPSKITEPGRVTTLTYDTKGNLTKKTVTAGTVSRSWAYTYNTKGQPLTINGPRTDVNDLTSFAYGTDGNLIKITDALNHVTQITSYNANGLPLRVVDPNGLVTTFTYNALNRLETQNAGGETTRYDYTPWGDVSQITLPDGSFVAYDYDDAHRLTGVRDVRDNRIVYTLDEAGNRVKEEVFDASGELARTQSRVYDDLNQVVQIIGAQGQTTTFTRDPNGNVTSVNDPMGFITTNSYDELNRLIKQTDPLGGVVTFAYTAQDAIASVTDPRGLKTTYTRNGFGEETTVASPDTGSTVKTYDAAGNVISWTNAKGQKTTQTYDVLNRPVKTTYADGKTVTRQYDVGTYGIGHVTMITDSTGSTSFQYDQHGREIVRQQKIGTITLTTRRSYDAYGRPDSITYPSGRKVTMLYDVNTKQLAGMQVDGKTLLQNIAHAPFGPVTYWETGTGPWQYRVFDQDGLLQGINTQADELWFGRDPAGRVTEFYDTLFNWKGLTYDNGSRLVEETSETSWRGYDYNINGNRTRYGAVDNNVEVSYDYTYAQAQNWLTSRIGSTVKTITHDKTGNITSDGTRTFAYGADSFLLTATNAGVTTTYATNGLAQRVKKSNASGTTLYVTDDDGKLLGEYNAAGTAVQETVWLDGQPLGVIKGTTLYTVNTDQLGAPRTIQNPSGQVVWQWNHDGFGNGAPNEKPGAAASFIYNLRFPGQYYDKETGLYHNNYRDYDPTTGQYLESDPIGLAGGINPFVYVANDPVNKVDPTGESAVLARVVAPVVACLADPLCVAAVGGSISWLAQQGQDLYNKAGKQIGEMCEAKKNQCQPCSPYSQGTIGYIGPHNEEHFSKFHGRHLNPHYNLFVVNQMPYPGCECRWNKNYPDAAEPPVQSGWVDLNNGFPVLTP